MKKIISVIKTWYRGDYGDPEYNFVTQEYEFKRTPYRHWTAKATEMLLITPYLYVWRAFRKNPNLILTQVSTFLAIVIAALSLYLQIKDDKIEHKQCKITGSENNTVSIQCIK